jgi:hypothetical protein
MCVKWTRCKITVDRDRARSKCDFDRDKARLPEPEFFTGFAQDYSKHVAICSLVLIHNVGDSEFSQLVAKMCVCANVIFVFEDVTQTRPSSPHTRIRSKGELRIAFADHGFVLQQPERSYRLLADEVAFMKFVRTDTHASSAHD